MSGEILHVWHVTAKAGVAMVTSERALGVHQGHELLSAFERAGIDGARAQAIINCPRNALARSMVELLDEQTGIKMLFGSPDQQIANLRQWINHGFLQGFTEADFGSIMEAKEKLPPPVDLTVPVLVPYLDQVGETFDALWDVIESDYDEHSRWHGLKSDKDHLRLADGINHPGRCLRWEIIDLGANRIRTGREVFNMRGPDSAHAGVMAAVAHFPNWVAAIGTKVPSAQITGYEANIRGHELWMDVPHIGRLGQGVGLHAVGLGMARYDGAPVIRKVVS